MQQKYQHILITGASSGLGRALALSYARAGVLLILQGRDEARLAETGDRCRAQGAEVFCRVLDVKDHAEMVAWLSEIDAQWPIDLVVANAGRSQGQSIPSFDVMDDILQTNVYGVLNTVLPLIPGMKDRRRGHIVVISSLAAFRTLPGRMIYSTSKIAVRYFCDAWRLELEKYGIKLTCVHPGFIRTPLTDQNKHPMPMMMSAENAAEIITAGVAKGKAVVAFPRILYYFMRLLNILPYQVSDFLIRKFVKY